MFASVDCNESPAVEVNGVDSAGVAVPACPVVDRRWEGEDLQVKLVLFQQLAHAPHGDAAVFDICDKRRKLKIVKKFFKKSLSF